MKHRVFLYQHAVQKFYLIKVFQVQSRHLDTSHVVAFHAHSQTHHTYNIIRCMEISLEFFSKSKSPTKCTLYVPVILYCDFRSDFQIAETRIKQDDEPTTQRKKQYRGGWEWTTPKNIKAATRIKETNLLGVFYSAKEIYATQCNPDSRTCELRSWGAAEKHALARCDFTSLYSPASRI